jgi:hypothetical protein
MFLPAYAAEPGAEPRAARALESARGNPLALHDFLFRMPKGGDLHNHLSGAVYAESYIQFAADDGVCIDRRLLVFTAQPCDEAKYQVPATAALRDPVLYREMIDALSMRDFYGPGAPHDHFFDTFGRFGLVSRGHTGEMLAEAMRRAGDQNESYLELTIGLDRGGAGALGIKLGWQDDFAAMRDKLLAGGLRDTLAAGRKALDDAEARARKELGCDGARPSPGCGVQVRFIFEVYRGLPRESVFAQTLAGFEMVQTDPRVVAVNPVMPEDGYTSMRDYTLHMRMFDFFHQLYPKVHLTLHAGELAPGLVRPDGLLFHVRQAVELGHAERIGHGVDVMFEEHPTELLRAMAQKKVAVEICLTSNDLILGVRGQSHPFPLYRKAGVPVTIATDDEGVSRSNLTAEYERAVRDYALTYAELKQLVRDSLRYSFAAGEQKKKLEEDLEKRFATFEGSFSAASR